jgi:lysophospholipase L1-like esterase
MGRYVLDLKAKMPYHDMEEEERDEIWDDGLHFTANGYERIGWWVGAAVLAILKGRDEWTAFLNSD